MSAPHYNDPIPLEEIKWLHEMSFIQASLTDDRKPPNTYGVLTEDKRKISTQESGDVINSIAKFRILYTIYDQCEWNGIPNQRIVIVYCGIKSANETGFLYRFETYDYSQDGTNDIHQHGYDPDVIDYIIDLIFDRTERIAE